MKDHVDDLELVIEEYRTNLGSQDQLLDLPMCTWADGFKQMDAAKVQIDEKHDKGLGRCRALWHKLGNYIKPEDIDPWLDLIPGGYRLSVIRASIVLVLKVSNCSVQKGRARC